MKSDIQLISSDTGSDLPLPRWGVLRGKSSRTSRRWRMYLVRFDGLHDT
jgi:hypothetical protein